MRPPKLVVKEGKTPVLTAEETRELIDSIVDAPSDAGQLTGRRLAPGNILHMVKRRAKGAGFDPDQVCCHTFRGTGITTYLENGGQLETAQHIAGHASATTTKLYDRRSQNVQQEEIERIRI